MNVEDAIDQLYRGKVILAPMVRAGTLPFRALALRYGADTVFTEEVIDRRVVNAVRTENPVLGTVDYVEKRGKKGIATPFQTCPALERGRLVYQIGTGDATNALRAAQHVERDVAAVDINMGCPKKFSLQGGMGAALLKQPQLAADIVGTLRRNLSVPVSVKIRLLETPGETVEFARRMEKAGACALSVHVRKVGDTPASKARWEELRPVVDAVNIPVIANGDMYTRADMAGIKTLSGCSSVMLARPALLNCSIFKPDGHVLPLKEVIQQYLRECFRYDSVYQNAKYTVMEMLTKRRHPDHLKESISLGLPGGAPGMREVTPAKTLEQLARLWDVGADFDAETVSRRKRAEQLGEATSIEQAERGTVHKFDDAYFLGTEEARIGNAVGGKARDSSDAPDPNAARGRGGRDRENGGGGNGGVEATAMAVGNGGSGSTGAPTTTTAAIARSTCTGGGDNCVGGGHGSGGGGGTDAEGGEEARPRGGDRAGGGEAEGIVARSVVAVVATAREASRGGGGDGDSGGGAGTGTAVAEEGQQPQQQRSGGVACSERGRSHERGEGEEDGSFSGDGAHAEEGLRQAWVSSKRPREEEEEEDEDKEEASAML
ncbi:unnamed protein product [Ectocarpus sp. 4 AP-2014]